jgi:hypothetical protein
MYQYSLPNPDAKPCSEQTIGKLAASARKFALQEMTEAEYARKLLAFDAEVIKDFKSSREREGFAYEQSPQEELLKQVAFVIAKFKAAREPQELQLCLLWLAGKGWGNLTLASLALLLELV